jgi:phospholipid/cholesterol/gamma-HCH transport system substrate-binding protein
MVKIRREAKIGLFALITMVALYWGINFIRGKDLFGRNSTYYAVYDQVNGIQKSSAVMVKGFKVGVVSSIIYDPAKSDKIVLELSIRSKYKVANDSEARIFSDGLIGGKALEIVPGVSNTYLHSGDTIRSSIDHDLLEMAGSDLEAIKRKASALVNDLTATLNSLNNVITENADHINTTMGNLAQISSSLNTSLSSERGDLRGILANINAVTATLKSNTDNIDRIIGNVESITDSLKQADFSTAVNNLTSTLDEFNGVISKVNNGEGTLGKLVTDEALYDSLQNAVTDLSALLEDLKANPKRYVHFSLFGKKDK